VFGNVSVMWFELLLFVLFELFKLCSIFCFYSVFDLCYVMFLWLKVTVLFTSLPKSLFWSQLLGSDLKRTVTLCEAFEVLFLWFYLKCYSVFFLFLIWLCSIFCFRSVIWIMLCNVSVISLKVSFVFRCFNLFSFSYVIVIWIVFVFMFCLFHFCYFVLLFVYLLSRSDVFRYGFTVFLHHLPCMFSGSNKLQTF